MILCVGLSPALQRTQLLEGPLEIGEVNRAIRTLITASGKGVNVARVLATLGTPVRLVQPLGGPTGQMHAQLAERDGVSQTVVGVPTLTRICTTVLANGEVTELLEESAPLPPEAGQALYEAAQKALVDATALCCTGSLPPGVGDDFYAKLIRMAKEKGKRTLIDAQKAPLQLALAEKPWLVKINRQEAAAMLNLPLTADSATLCAMLQQAGAENAIVTDGAAGATLAESTGAVWHIASPPDLAIINPIGSGDAMNAGILTGIEQGMPLPEATRLGVACAAANCLTPTSGVVDPKNVSPLLEKVAITPKKLA